MTFGNIQKRTAYLRGESDYTTASTDKTIIDDHINAAVEDIVNAYPFAWDIKTTTITLSSGVANLPTDFNPRWGLHDARIVKTSTSDDDVFSHIPIQDRDAYGSTSYVYWITYSTTSEVYQFNSTVQSGTVTIYYYFLPATMTATADVCVVPDGEAVAYLAAAKMWIGDERNQKLKLDYEQEAQARILSMYQADLNFGQNDFQGSIIDYNPTLKRGGADTIEIDRS